MLQKKNGKYQSATFCDIDFKLWGCLFYITYDNYSSLLVTFLSVDFILWEVYCKIILTLLYGLDPRPRGQSLKLDLWNCSPISYRHAQLSLGVRDRYMIKKQLQNNSNLIYRSFVALYIRSVQYGRFLHVDNYHMLTRSVKLSRRLKIVWICHQEKS